MLSPKLDTSSNATMPIVLSSIAVLVAYLLVKIFKLGSRESHLPPGPKTLPILGNLHQLPLAYAHVQFTAWAKQYGPIYSLKAGSQTLVVLTGAKEVKELLDRRAANSSDRPNLHVANELITNGRHLLAMPYGDRWRLVRKIIHQHLTIKMCEEHHQKVQSAESVQMILDLLEKPQDHYKRVLRYSTAVILSIIYGRRGPTFEGAVQDIYDVMEPWSEIVETGATPPVDVFPILKWLPNIVSPWRKKSLHVRALELKLYGGLAQQVKERRKRGVDRGSLLDKVYEMVEDKGDPILDDEQVAYIGGVLLGRIRYDFFPVVGFHTGGVPLAGDAKAQAEVDSVCGRGRLPTFEDYPNLPYIRMCVKEVQRWRPVVITAFPHMLTQDERYGQYVLPRGTTIIGNTWGLHMDEERFPDPQEFKPERFKDFPLSAPEYAAMSGDDARDHWGYGYGRRICVGLHIAERSMFINTARLAWAFNIKEDPLNPVDIHAFTAGFLSAPKPYTCFITPRDAGVRKVLDEEMVEAKTMFKQYEN